MDHSNDQAIRLGKVFAKLARPQNTRISIIIYIALATKLHVALWPIIAGSFLIIAAYAGVTAYNDQADIEIDRQNERTLPLAQKQLNHSQANIFIIVTLLIGGVLQLGLHQPSGIIFWLIYLFLGWIYSASSFKISHRGLLAPILLSFCYVGLPIYLAASQSGTDRALNSLILLLAAIPFSMASTLFKDYKDQRGDLQGGKMTPLLRYGDKGIKSIAWGLTIGGGLVMLYLQRYLGLSLLAYLVALVALFQLSRQSVPQPKLVACFSYALVLAIACLVYSSPFLFS